MNGRTFLGERRWGALTRNVARVNRKKLASFAEMDAEIVLTSAPEGREISVALRESRRLGNNELSQEVSRFPSLK